MIRFVVILLASILLITVVRAVLGIVLKGFSDMVRGAQPTSAQQQPSPQQQVPLAGELKRDPVCGTFVSTASSLKKSVGGEIVHFCSAACRDRYPVAS